MRPCGARSQENNGILMVFTACWPRSFVTAHSIVACAEGGVIRKMSKIAPDGDEDAPAGKAFVWTMGASPTHLCVIRTVTGAPSASLPVQENPIGSSGPGAP